MPPAIVCLIFMGLSAKSNTMTAYHMLQGQSNVYPVVFPCECRIKHWCFKYKDQKHLFVGLCDKTDMSKVKKNNIRRMIFLM